VLGWRVVGLTRSEARFAAARGSQRLTDFVGREEEVALLLRRWRQALQGDGQVVLLSGEPGIGKSRIAQELSTRIAGEPHVRLVFQGSPYHTRSAFYPVIAHFEQLAGFERDDSAERKLDKLEAAVARLGGMSDIGLPLFASLLSLPLERYPPLKFSPQRQREELIRARVDQLRAIARRQPLLLLFEDVQWIDPSSLEMLDLSVQLLRGMRALAIITFRPEFQPRWTEHSHVTLLTLSRLDHGQAAAIVDRITGGKPLPDAVLERIVARTDGVPLFVEELTKAVLESGLLQEGAERFELSGTLPPLAIPATLQDSLMARLDHLAAAKEVAQVGACIGREFSRELLSAVCPLAEAQLDAALAQVVESGLVHRRGVPPELVYTFKHALVQDAAYNSLLRSRRQQVHAAIGAALERASGEGQPTAPELLAHHFTLGGLNELAVPCWLRAGKQALARPALPEAISHLTAALELNAQLPASDERDRLELDIRMALGTAYFALLGWVAVEVVQTLDPARELARRLGDHDVLRAVLYYIWFHYGMRSDYGRALATAGELDELARNSCDSRAKVTALMTRACALSWIGKFREARDAGDELLRTYDFEQHRELVHAYNHDPKCLTLVWAGVWLWALGYPDQARAACIEQLAHARRVAHPFNLLWGLSGGAMGLLLRGDTQLARQWMEEIPRIGREQAMPIADLLYQWWGGYTSIAEGGYEQGLALLTPGHDLWRESGGLHLVPYANLNRAQALAGMGRMREAATHIYDALELIEKTDHRMHEAEVYRVKGELLLRADARARKDAEEAFRKALDVARAQHARGWELRAATSLARLWQSEGRGEEARALLAPVYAWFTEGFDTPDLRCARELLESLPAPLAGEGRRW
jgi:predicted ATPase